MSRLHPHRVFVVCLALTAVFAAPAHARWRPSVDLGPALRTPAVGFDPSGGAALAWPSAWASQEQTVMVARAPFGGDLGAAKAAVTGVPDPAQYLQIVLPGRGTAVLRAGAHVLVAPAGTTRFDPPQDLGGVQEEHLQQPDASLIGTPQGEVIASVMHTEGEETTAVLPAGASSFGASQQYPSLNPNAGQPVPVASDPQGNAFLADFGGCSKQSDQSVALMARAPGGGFRVSTALRCQSISTANPFPVIGAGGNGGLALLTVTGTPGHNALVVQTRYRGRWSSPHVLARTRPMGSCHSGHWCPTRQIQTLGPPVVGLGGGVTVGWDTCDGDGRNCTVSAAQGSLRPGSWHTRTFSGRLGEQVGNSYATLSDCTKGRCQISVSLADRHGRFGSPRTLTHDGQIADRDELVEASGGRRRERAIIWTSSRGGLFASVSDPGRPGFGPTRRLAADGSVSHDQVAYQTGPRDQLIATWLTPDGTAHAAAYAP